MHPRVRPQLRADTWVRPYEKIVVGLQIGISPILSPIRSFG
jgi:hypothetical protein